MATPLIALLADFGEDGYLVLSFKPVRAGLHDRLTFILETEPAMGFRELGTEWG